MVALLDLPSELLLLVLRQLELGDLLKFCAINHDVRATFKPQCLPLIFQIKDYWARVRAVEEISYLLLCHALSELYRRRVPVGRMNFLVKRGASFGYIANHQLVRDAVLRYGPGKNLNFLFKHGGSLRQIKGGADTLLMEAVRTKGARSSTVAMLVRHGVRLNKTPRIHDYLVDQFLEAGYLTSRTDFLISNGADFRQSTGGINKVLERYYLRFGHGDFFDNLIAMGADIHEVPCGVNKLLETVMFEKGDGVATDYLLSIGAFFDVDTLNQRLEDEFNAHGQTNHVYHLLEFPGVSLTKVPNGINKLLENKLRETKVPDTGFLAFMPIFILLSHGASLAEVPDVETYLDDLLKDALESHVDLTLFRDLITYFRGWNVGTNALAELLEETYREVGTDEIVDLLLDEDWIPRSEELDSLASYSLDTLFNTTE